MCYVIPFNCLKKNLLFQADVFRPKQARKYCLEKEKEVLPCFMIDTAFSGSSQIKACICQNLKKNTILEN